MVLGPLQIVQEIQFFNMGDQLVDIYAMCAGFTGCSRQFAALLVDSWFWYRSPCPPPPAPPAPLPPRPILSHIATPTHPTTATATTATTTTASTGTRMNSSRRRPRL